MNYERAVLDNLIGVERFGMEELHSDTEYGEKLTAEDLIQSIVAFDDVDTIVNMHTCIREMTFRKLVVTNMLQLMKVWSPSRNLLMIEK